MTVIGSILGFLLSYAGLAAAVPDRAAGILIELGPPTARVRFYGDCDFYGFINWDLSCMASLQNKYK